MTRRTTPLALTLGALLLAIGTLASCQADDVVVADRREGDEHPRPDGEGPACTSNDECPPNAFCDKPSCDAPAGTCALRPLSCDNQPSPVCACDRITYWNDCLRRQRGIASSVTGECRVGFACGGPAPDCPGGASCARLLPFDARCEGPTPGACWALPPSCPPEPDRERWTACGGGACASTCEAIRSEQPFRLGEGAACERPN